MLYIVIMVFWLNYNVCDDWIFLYFSFLCFAFFLYDSEDFEILSKFRRFLIILIRILIRFFFFFLMIIFVYLCYLFDSIYL